MYELVNTSVPNGLMAGTHGFATVAMTKGMSDAIRMRVENFCAYPHRTSAHDASYYMQNPVNWFHLMLPNGDHVVGRTAPAEFDYTGRTNRLARTMYFSAAEMPRVGGAYILAAEAERLCAPWSGEPRYLAEDKSAAERLRRASSRAGAAPSHWRQMFGAKGAEYAKRFAVLLAQNIRGGNKCIYFKADAADMDGTRLLGLFSDLINQLPEELAAQVTFSTFAACVPGGVACHLRGVFDKDRAFEASAALSPWVDCEAGCVRHEELLPKEEIVIQPSVGEVKACAADLPRVEQPIERKKFAQSVANTRRAEIFPQSAKVDPFIVWLGIGAGALVVILVVVVLCAIQPWGKSEKKVDSTFLMMQSELEDWYAGKTNRLNEVEHKIDACERSAAVQERKGSVEAMMNGLKAELEEQGLTGYEEKLEDVKARGMRLLEKMDRKVAALKEQEKEDQKSAAQEKAKTEKARQEAEAAEKKAAEETAAKVKQQKDEEEKKKAEEAKRNKALKDLVITKEFSSSKSWEKALEESEKEALTNSRSIIFFSPRGRTEGQYQCKLVLGKKQITLIGNPKLESWLVVYIPSLERVYWQWGDEVRGRFFAEQDKINLAELVFGGKNEAYELYKKERPEFAYLLSWKDVKGGQWNYYTVKEEISIEQFQPEKKGSSGTEEKNDGKNSQEKLKEIEAELIQLANDENKMKDYIKQYACAKGNREGCDKIKDKKKKKAEKEKYKKQMDNLQVEAKPLVEKYVPASRSQVLGVITEDDVTEVMKEKRKPLEKEKYRLEAAAKEDEKPKEEEQDGSKWQEAIRNQVYALQILTGANLSKKKQDVPFKVEVNQEEE